MRKHNAGVPLVAIGSLLVAGTILNYTGRQAFSIMAPAAEAAISLSNAQTARLFEAFLLPYSLTPLLWGYLIDRIGIRRVYGTVALTWSILQLGYVFAHSFHQLFLLQIALGVTESVNFVACSKATAVWCRPPQRARLSGFVQAAAVMGAVLTPPLCAVAIHFGGWRSIFVWNAVMTLLWVMVWFAVYKDRGPTAKITLASNVNEKPISVVKHPNRLIAVLIAVRFLADPVWWFYLLWLPTYLVQKGVATAANVGKSLWVPYVAAALGATLAGAASDSLIAASGTTISSRLTVMLFAVAVMPIGLLLLRADTLWSVLAVLCVVLAGHMAWKANLEALTADCFSPHIVGRIASLFNAGSGLGGVMFFAYVGVVLEKLSYAPVFVVLAFVHPCAFVLLWLVIRRACHTQPMHALSQVS